MAILTNPASSWHSSWLDAHAEWGPGSHEDGFGLLPGDDVTSADGFRSWLDRLSDDRQCTYWWITEGDAVLGGIALRHTSHPFASWAGHLGYGIRPSARGRGLATWALARVVEQASILGMDRVLSVCEVGNSASAMTLQRQGGVLEKSSQDSPVLRYWITTNASHD